MALQKYNPSLKDRMQEKKDIEKFLDEHTKKLRLETAYVNSGKKLLAEVNRDITKLKKKK